MVVVWMVGSQQEGLIMAFIRSLDDFSAPAGCLAPTTVQKQLTGDLRHQCVWELYVDWILTDLAWPWRMRLYKKLHYSWCCRAVTRKWRHNINPHPIKSRDILMFLSLPLGVSFVSFSIVYGMGAKHQCNWLLGFKGGLELVDCVTSSLIGTKQFRKWINPFFYFIFYVRFHLIDVHRRSTACMPSKWAS